MGKKSQLGNKGANVVIASRKLDNCEKIAGSLKSLGVKTLAVKCDLAIKEDIDDLLADATVRALTLMRLHRARTDMMEHMFQPEFKSAHDKMMSLIPAGRVGLEDDMKVLAVFLVAKTSDYITSAIIPVDGGILAK